MTDKKDLKEEDLQKVSGGDGEYHYVFKPSNGKQYRCPNPNCLNPNWYDMLTNEKRSHIQCQKCWHVGTFDEFDLAIQLGYIF